MNWITWTLHIIFGKKLPGCQKALFCSRNSIVAYLLLGTGLVYTEFGTAFTTTDGTKMQQHRSSCAYLPSIVNHGLAARTLLAPCRYRREEKQRATKKKERKLLPARRIWRSRYIKIIHTHLPILQNGTPTSSSTKWCQSTYHWIVWDPLRGQ